MSRMAAVLLGLLLLAPAALALGGTAASAGAVAATTASVDVLDNSFSPPALSVIPGTVVTFTNRGSRAHTVTASSPANAFDSGYILPGGSWTYTFTVSGTYVYHCEIHTGMAGTISVVSGTPAPTGTLISITDNAFTPPSLAVDPGTTVSWRNDGTVTHTVTSSVFGAQRLAPGQSFSYTFTSAGTYPYVCDIHAGMAGTVSVGAPPPSLPPTTPTPSPTAAPPISASVMIMNNLFTPATLTVDPGATVTWTNHDAVTHTVTRAGLFDMMVRPGQSVTFTFTTAGSYDYYCAVHAGMSGSIVVRGTPVASPSPSPSPSASPTATPMLSGTVVDIGDNSYSPASVSIAAGATVTWRNTGSRYHTVTGMGFGTTIAPGGTYQYTFSAAGPFSYQCDFHPEMSGMILVGGAAPPPPAPPPAPVPVPSLAPGTSRVDVVDSAFSPASITIATGSTVTWLHRGRAMHSVTAIDGSFDATLRTGQTFSFTFTKPGTYTYLCQFHDGMTGTVVVTGAAVSPSPTPIRPAPSPTPSPTPTAPAPPAGAAIPPKALTVVIADNNFTPGTTRVATGTTVAWVNHGRIRHTVTSTSSVFDSGLMSPEGVYSVTFDTPGTYPYLCDIHPAMRGTIEVYAADGAVPAAVATPAPTSAPTPSPTPAAAGASTRDIHIVDNAFEPRSITVATGTTLRWMNMGKAKHTVTFTAGATSTSELLATAAVYEITLGTPGTYAYICALHPEMTGEVTVTGAATGEATPTAAPSQSTTTRTAAPTPRASATAQSKEAGAGWPWILGIGLGLIGAFGIGLPIVAALATSPEERDASLRRRRGW